MRPRTKLALAALTATLLLGVAVTSATAGRISTSNNRFRVTWTALQFGSLEIEGPIICPLTLEGSFHSATIRKTRGALIGAVTKGIVKSEACEGGNASVLRESLPWHLTYESFGGTLPRIQEVTFLLRRYEFRIFNFFVGNCLYLDQGRAEENLALSATVNEATGQVTVATPLLNRYASFRIGGAFCPRRGLFEGPGQVFLLGSSTTRITVTLI
jgi:hypothetical protein